MTTKKKSSYSDELKKYGRVSSGRFLVAWRSSEEMSQAQFARKLGLPEKSVVAIAIEDALAKEGMKYLVELNEAA
jgi:DNA-binding transcriptional regulator YiaG